MEQWFVVSLAAINAAISASFAYGVTRHAASWHWPPSWLRVVANWLTVKAAFFFISITLCWAFGFVQFDPGVPWWGKAIYLIPLIVLVIAHAWAAFYWLTGRAATDDVILADEHSHD